MPTRPFLCELFSLLFFRTKAVPGRMWIGGWLGWQLKWQWQWHCHWELIHFGHTVFASAPFFWLSAFVRQLAIVWATEIAHSWTSAGGGGAPFRDQTQLENTLHLENLKSGYAANFSPLLFLIRLTGPFQHSGISASITTSSWEFSKR